MAGDDDLLSPDDGAELSQALLQPRILWGALAASVALYVGLGWFINAEQAPAPIEPALVYVLGGVALAVAAAIPMIRRTLMPPVSDRSDGLGLTRKMARAATARFVVANIVTFALAEAISLFGLVLTFLSHDPRYVLGFAAGSLVLFAVYFPRADTLAGVWRGARS